MPSTQPANLKSPMPIPAVDIGEPVAVIPVASVAPVEGQPDGERINTFTLAVTPGARTTALWAPQTLSDLRDRVDGQPLTYVAGAFALGVLVARLLR